MDKIYKIVVATPLSKENFELKSKIFMSLEKLKNNFDCEIIYNNKTGLSKLYNSFLKEENTGKKIIFVHDDVLIEDLFLLEKLEDAFDSYDIIGLAGAKSCDLNSQIPAWHLMSKREDFVGEVSHSDMKKFWTNSYGITPSRSLIIDGLFIAVNVKKLLETNTKFDEDFTFHHYDITFCLNANQNKLKIGVYPIKVTHYGLGDSMMSQEWRESALKFQKKYKK
jgi:GT2 family glycosyltransferase